MKLLHSNVTLTAADFSQLLSKFNSHAIFLCVNIKHMGDMRHTTYAHIHTCMAYMYMLLSYTHAWHTCTCCFSAWYISVWVVNLQVFLHRLTVSVSQARVVGWSESV